MKKLFWVMLALFLTACSGKPSVGEIESQVKANLNIADDGSSLAELSNFKKLNGFEKDDKTYIADIQYDLVFKKGLKDFGEEMKKESQGSPLAEMQAELLTKGMQMQFGNFEAGHRITREEKVTLIRTDNGWQISE